ncbi:hypothetical protein MRB53_003411 [Persea americana]|uniref:Uncharacterized protein n=1 Tax=Persea americana TaxID=3435 RepID=A0ACC2MXY7_PERAE|nr:hypothetical protein MRB53_003411 [Persea americana]
MGHHHRRIPLSVSFIIFIFFVSSLQPLTAARPFNGEWGSRKGILMLKGSLQSPSRSGCTYVNGNPGPSCPINGKKFAAHAHPASPGFNNHMLRFGIATVGDSTLHQDQQS